MSLEMQSKLAIMSFSLRVSQAKRNGSKISLGLSPPCPDFTISSATLTLSRKGAERFASFDAAMVSSAEEMKTTETVLPLESVSERLCEESVDGREGARPLGVEGLLSTDCLMWPLVARGEVGRFGRGAGGRRAAGDTGEGTGLAGGVGGGAASSASSPRSIETVSCVPACPWAGAGSGSAAPFGGDEGACEIDVGSVSE